jgi:hypothetical protein
MSALAARSVRRAFEELGQIREHLTAIERSLVRARAASRDDVAMLDELAEIQLGIAAAWEALTFAGNRVARQIQNATGSRDTDLSVNASRDPEGARS